MAGNVVAEKQDAVGLKRIRVVDDTADTAKTHERLTGVQIGYDGHF